MLFTEINAEVEKYKAKAFTGHLKFGIEKSNAILRVFGVDKLVFATDYPDNRKLEPTEIYDKYFEILGKMDFTQEEVEQICKNNAIKMIGLK